MSTPVDPVRPLRRIEAWIARNHPDRLPFLRPGADLHTLKRIEAKLGKPMPLNIRILYAAHDGQPEGAPALYLNQRWLPLDLVAVAWEDLCLRHCGRSKLVPPNNSKFKQILQGVSWSSDWLPVFGSSRGDHYCIDLRPDPAEHHGQVIWFLYDAPERSVIARSIDHLLSRVADGVETGTWQLDDGYDGLSD